MEIKRTFIPGDEWIYYKLYTGHHSSDQILVDVILPIVDKLKQRNIIDCWFFIRYYDDDFHLRIRFHIKNKTEIGCLIELMNKHIKKYVDNGIIWKVMLDSYQRELERYKPETMDLSEYIFFTDSDMILKYIKTERQENIFSERWIFGIKSVEKLINCFVQNLDEKVKLLSELRIGFLSEFGLVNDRKGQLSNKYRKDKVNVEKHLESPGKNAQVDSIIKLRTDFIEKKIQQLKVSKKDLKTLIPSYTHMSINRLFRSRQRMYEMIIYDYLYRFYQSKIAKEKITEKELK